MDIINPTRMIIGFHGISGSLGRAIFLMIRKAYFFTSPRYSLGFSWLPDLSGDFVETFSYS